MSDRSHEARNAASAARLGAFVARLSDADLVRETGNGWTVAAALVHLAHRDHMTVVRWTAAPAGTLPPDIPPDVSDVINDSSLPLFLAVPPRVAAEMALAAAAEVDAFLAGLPDETLDAVVEAGFPRLVDRSIHRHAHLDGLEQALSAGAASA